MQLKDYAIAMAHYNRWMNEKIYTAVAPLTDAERKQDRGAFFVSIHGTLNHLLLIDQAWQQRFSGLAVTMQTPRDEVCADFDQLRRIRAALDNDLIAWAEQLPERFETESMQFFSVAYQKQMTLPLWAMVLQVFNHQTHHRGQITTLLAQLGVDIGTTDIPVMPYFTH